MVEKAPKINADTDFDNKLFVNSILESFEVIVKAQKQYLYWDKVKYLKDDFIKPIEIWEAIKKARLILQKEIVFTK